MPLGLRNFVANRGTYCQVCAYDSGQDYLAAWLRFPGEVMRRSVRTVTNLSVEFVLASALFLVSPAAAQQAAFAVATIRPSAAEVQFDRDGKTEISAGMLRMQDVTVRTCI